jgi:hypothetical protein
MDMKRALVGIGGIIDIDVKVLSAGSRGVVEWKIGAQELRGGIYAKGTEDAKGNAKTHPIKGSSENHRKRQRRSTSDRQFCPSFP